MSFNHWPATHWPQSTSGGGGGPSFPAIVNATTAKAIRDRAIAVLHAIAPTLMTGTDHHFRAYHNEAGADFRTYALKNSQSMFRRFQVRTDGDDDPVAVSNMDVEEAELHMTILIAYPQTARTGPTEGLGRDDVIDADRKLLNLALGIYARVNFSPPNPDAVPFGLVIRTIRDNGVDFLELKQRFTYRRLVS